MGQNDDKPIGVLLTQAARGIITLVTRVICFQNSKEF